MSNGRIDGNWKQFVAKLKETWGRLTDDDWKVIEERPDQLIGKIQERYGITPEEALRQVAEFDRKRGGEHPDLPAAR